jgi:hypothetical protein
VKPWRGARKRVPVFCLISLSPGFVLAGACALPWFGAADEFIAVDKSCFFSCVVLYLS